MGPKPPQFVPRQSAGDLVTNARDFRRYVNAGRTLPPTTLPAVGAGAAAAEAAGGLGAGALGALIGAGVAIPNSTDASADRRPPRVYRQKGQTPAAPQGDPAPAPAESGEASPGPAPRRYKARAARPALPPEYVDLMERIKAGQQGELTDAEMAMMEAVESGRPLNRNGPDQPVDDLQGFQPIYTEHPAPAAEPSMEERINERLRYRRR